MLASAKTVIVERNRRLILSPHLVSESPLLVRLTWRAHRAHAFPGAPPRHPPPGGLPSEAQMTSQLS